MRIPIAGGWGIRCALLALGCAACGGTDGRADLLPLAPEPGSESSIPDEASVPDAGTSDATETDADVELAAVPPPLTWTPVSANITEGDIVSIWGTSSADVYVGTDMSSVYHLRYGASRWSGFSSSVAGGGWGGSPTSVYAVGASAWLARMGIGSAGGLYLYDGDQGWDSVAAGTFYGVWGSSPNDLYAVGTSGIVHATDGESFVAEGPAGTGALRPSIRARRRASPSGVAARTTSTRAAGTTRRLAGAGRFTTRRASVDGRPSLSPGPRMT
jgi:hypothetical protein